ncbi:hypothetical protein CSB45_09620 [candidate division KSB3 bacterium]|uniref:RNA-binding protein n=1 Tax=candidate division KSB3 bacterium TaxID=2044937 RepID=A0A2G6E4B1_9BACT|nr:MAG: hypothetical protein CSB45_09620 [candidate division KSB3 bacterium]PIE29425.1 MAG: hypothetical protein CSA57_08455 [candidate division KSB3 bacterium]
MSIFIDGYNYIGRSQDFSLDDPNARDKVIYLMGQYCARAKKNVTIIFDGNHFVHDANRKRRYGRVTVVYTSPIYTADDAIKKMVRTQQPRKRSSLLVVTSDVEILDYVKGHGAGAMRSEDFERTLYKTLTAPKEIDRVNIQLSDKEVQEWLALFDAEPAADTAQTDRKKAPTAPKKKLQNARHARYTPETETRPRRIDRENVRLSPREIDEWMQIFGVDDDEND